MCVVRERAGWAEMDVSEKEAESMRRTRGHNMHPLSCSFDPILGLPYLSRRFKFTTPSLFLALSLLRLSTCLLVYVCIITGFKLTIVHETGFVIGSNAPFDNRPRLSYDKSGRRVFLS